MESAISSVLSNLGTLALSEAKFLADVPNKIKSIERKLRAIQSYLKDADESKPESEEDHQTSNFRREMKDVAYRAENVIEKIVWMERRRNRRKGFVGTMLRYAHTPSDMKTLHQAGAEIDQINLVIPEISEIINTLSGMAPSSGEDSTAKSHLDFEVQGLRDDEMTVISIEEDHVVGFDGEIAKIVEELCDPMNKQLTAVSIVGMGGLGKSTLARKVYTHPNVKHDFFTLIWLTVSQNYKIDKLVKEILLNTFKTEKVVLENMGEDEARIKLFDSLNENRYLIVLDDIWSTSFWNEINCNSKLFPDTNNGSRIILTTRNKEVAKCTNIRNYIHELGVLDNEKSWELLKRKAFPSYQIIDESTKNDLESLGRQNAQQCNGLPLALVVLGGYLSSHLDQQTWSTMANAVNWADESSSLAIVSKILTRSYHDLPSELKPCFLYLNAFPEDYVINVSKLIKLWIAEGFISPNPKYTREKMARMYIDKLCERGLVQVVGKSKAHGWINEIKIHDVLHDWGTEKARRDGFVNVWRAGDPAAPPENTTIYRAALHGFYDKELSMYVPNLRTMLAFDLPEMDPNFHGLNFLRVLDLNGIYLLKKLPPSIDHMIHIRYLGLVDCSMIELPSNIGNLFNLQTLDARETDIYDLPDSFWSIPALRHVKIDTVYYSKTPKFGDQKGLQTISLEIETSHKSVADGLVRWLEKMNQLEKLNLSYEIMPEQLLTLFKENHHLQALKLTGRLTGKGMLPNSSLFPPNLTKLHLSDTCLSQDPIPILAKLPKLVVLLLWDVYDGTSLDFPQDGFPKLQDLRLNKFHNVKQWKIERGAMSRLNSLSLFEFGEITTEMLEELQYLTSLKVLRLTNTSKCPSDYVKKFEENGCKVVQDTLRLDFSDSSDEEVV